MLRSRGIAIEYDGGYDHAYCADRDLRKNAAIEAGGFVVLRVRENPLPALGKHSINVSSSLSSAKMVHTTITALRHLDPSIPQVDVRACSEAVKASAERIEKVLEEAGYWLRGSPGRGTR